MGRRVLISSLLVVAMVLGLGCDRLFGTRIKSILDNPRDYENKQVTVTGTVTKVTNLLVYKSFLIDDGSGQIRVVTERVLPKEGSRITVTATVKQGFSIGDESKVVLIEKEPEQAQQK